MRKLFEKHFGHSEDFESWKSVRVGGRPQETFGTYSSHDCSGQVFCRAVDSYLWGFITVGHYSVDV